MVKKGKVKAKNLLLVTQEHYYECVTESVYALVKKVLLWNCLCEWHRKEWGLQHLFHFGQIGQMAPKCLENREKACNLLPHGNHLKLKSSPIIHLKWIIPLDIQIISLIYLYQDQLLIYLLITDFNARLYNKITHCYSWSVYTGCGRPKRESSTVNWCLALCMTYWHEGQMLCNVHFVVSSVDNL